MSLSKVTTISHRFWTTKVYPRVDYFQNRLKSLHPRFRRITDSLSSSLSDKAEIACIENEVTRSLRTPEVVVVSRTQLDPGDIVEQPYVLSLAPGRDVPSYPDTNMKVLVCYIVIHGFNPAGRDDIDVALQQFFLQIAPSLNDMKDVFIFLKFHQIVNDESTRACTEFLYSRVCERHQSWDGRTRILVDSEDGPKLSLALSNHLESKVVCVFDRVDCYLQRFLRKGRNSSEDVDVFDELFSQLLSCLENGHLHCDFAGRDDGKLNRSKETDEPEWSVEMGIEAVVQTTKCTLIPTLSQKYYVHHHILSTVIVDTRVEDQLKCSISPVTKKKLAEVLLLTMKKLQQNKIKQGSLDATLTSIETNRPLTSSRRPFRKRRKRRRRGIRRVMLKKDQKDHSYARKVPRVLQQLALDLQADMSKTIASLEKVMQRVEQLFNTFEKMRFEIKACVRQTVTRTFPKEPSVSLSSELRRDILRTPEVYGCGHVYGVFQIHAMSLDPDVKRKLGIILNRHGFRQHVRVLKVTSKPKPLAQTQHESGQWVHKRTVGSPNGSMTISKAGTLGGFAEDSNKNLYAITCAHVVGNGNEVLVHDKGFSYKPLGVSEKGLSLPPGNKLFPLIDFAAVKVVDEMKDRCIGYLRNEDGHSKKSGILQEHPGSNFKLVYKFGAKSNLTHGCIASDDYTQSLDDDSASNYLVMVEPLVDTNTDTFAEEGDSGSVICACNPDGDVVWGVSMLSGGDMKLDSEAAPKYMSFHLGKALEAFQHSAGVSLNLPEDCRI